MSKYEPLQFHLEKMAQSEWHVHFSDVEQLIAAKLPKSAYEYPAWWSNNPTGHSHSRAWIEAGWMTLDVNITGQTLTFRRVEKDRTTALRDLNIWGFMAGSVTVLNDYDLTEPCEEAWGEVAS
jgi:hypothetical protein